MKKLPLFVTGLLAVSAMSCNAMPEIQVLKNDQEVCMAQTIASINILNANQASEVRNVKLANSMKMSTTSNLDIDQIHNYTITVEEMLSDSSFNVVEESSDKAEYQAMIRYSANDIIGEKKDYVIYFNEVLKNDDLDDDNDDENEREKDSNEETEKEYALEGIAICGDDVYTLVGEKEIEEDEFELKLKISLDEETFIEIKQEIEEDETEYQYSVHSKGLNYKFSLCFEAEEDGNEYCIKIDDKQNKMTYKYKKEIEDGKQKLTIVVKTGEGQYHLLVEPIIDADIMSYQYTVKETKEVFVKTR